LNDILDKFTDIQTYRKLRKKFIPLEELAKDPRFYGYDLDPIESNAKQGQFRHSKAKIVAAICGNRAGKTNIGAVKFLDICLNRKETGRAWVVTESYDLQKSGVQEKILEYLKPEDIKHISWLRSDIVQTIVLNNNVTIEFKSYEQGRDKLQSAKLFCALIDEEPPENIFKEIYTRTVDLRGPIIMTFTPLKGLTWSYEQIYSAKGKDVEVYSWGMADNVMIPREEIELLRQKLSPKEAKMRLYGQYAGSETQVYYSFDREKHLKENIYNPELPVYVSIDWGVRVTAVTYIQRDKQIINNKPYDLFKFIDGAELNGYGYGQVMQWAFQNNGKHNYFVQDWFCDPAGRQRQAASRTGSSLLNKISEEYGIDFGYIKTLGIEESIEVVSSYLMNEYGQVRMVFEKNVKLNDKGHGFAERIEGYIRGEDGKPIKDDINDHINDSIRYCVMNIVKGENKKWVQH
jgi:phage terminase large subunit-like protein